MKNWTVLVSVLFALQVTGQTHFNRIFPTPPYSQPYVAGNCAPIVQTSDGGYLLNYSYGPATLDASRSYFSEIIKTDSLFTPQWRKELPGDNGKKIFSFTDSSSIVYSTYDGIIFEKINNYGNVLWAKKYNRTYHYNFTINNAIYNNSIIQLGGSVGDHSFGYEKYSGLLLSVDTSGNFIGADSIVISSFNNSEIYDLTHDNFGNRYIIGSGAYSNGNSFAAKILSNNTVAWCKKLSASGIAPFFSSSTTLSNGDLLIGGSLYNSSTGSHIILIRLSSVGALVWAKQTSQQSLLNKVQLLDNGNFLITGQESNGNIVITETDTTAKVIWAKKYSKGLTVSSAFLKNKNERYFAAYTFYPTLFNTDSLGFSFCSSSAFTLSFNYFSLSLTTASCSLYPITIDNSAYTNNLIPQLQVYKDTCNSFIVMSVNDFPVSQNLNVYPNPSNGNILINNVDRQYIKGSIKIYDLTGKLIEEYILDPNKNEQQLNTSLQIGIYLYQVIVDDKIITTDKIVITK